MRQKKEIGYTTIFNRLAKYFSLGPNIFAILALALGTGTS
jgi:hypothetical protein